MKLMVAQSKKGRMNKVKRMVTKVRTTGTKMIVTVTRIRTRVTIITKYPLNYHSHRGFSISSLII